MMHQLRPYGTYKAAGGECPREVPNHWDVLKLRHILRRHTERERPDLPLLSVVRDRGVILRDTTGSDQNHNYIPDDLSDYKVVRAGQFAMNKMKAWQGSYGVSCHDGIVSPAYFVFEVLGIEVDFFHTAIRSRAYVPAFTRASDGVRIGQWDLAEPRMREVQFLVPPAPEQAAVVRFLDHADRRIRRYICAKQKLIALLEEQKQAIIHQAVTSRIDVRTGRPYPAYKASGVEWLREVPEHWTVARLKFVATDIVDCLHETPKYVENGEFPAIRTADIFPGEVHLLTARRIEWAEYVRWIERLEPLPGDVLYSREGERFGIAACVPEGARLCISQRMMLFRIRPEHNPLFVMWMLNSEPVLAQARQYIMGATAPHVNVSTIRNYSLALPPRDEQDSLVESIERSTRELSGVIVSAERSTSFLREYRARLIADVVTGKLDVREAAAGLPEVDPLAAEDDSDDGSNPEAGSDGDEFGVSGQEVEA